MRYYEADRSIRIEIIKREVATSRRNRNRCVGEFLKELDLAEACSTGVPKIFRAMRRNGSPDPVFESDDDRTWFRVRLPVHELTLRPATEHETEHETEHVERLVVALKREMSRAGLQELLGVQSRPHFVDEYLRAARETGLIQMTLPDAPQSRKQRYRLTQAGKALVRRIRRRNGTRQKPH